MPYRMPGDAGTYYRPGERKGAGIVWRGRGPDGKDHEIGTGAFHHAAAKRKVLEFLDELDRHRIPAAGEQVTLRTAAAHYRAGTDLSSADSDRLDWMLARDGDMVAADVTQATVNAAVNSRRAERLEESGAAPSADTLTRDVVWAYRVVMRFAARMTWAPLRQFSSVKPLKTEPPKKPPRIARDDDVARLLEACESAIEEADKLPHAWQLPQTLRAFHAFVWLTHERGFRSIEWLRLEWPWLDLDAGRGRMLITKQGQRWKDFDLSPEAVEALRAMGPKEAGKVFPWATRRTVYYWSDKLGGPIGVKWTPHDSRRAVVTDLIRKTGDTKLAGDYVGHGSEKTTLRYRVVDAGEATVALRLGRVGAIRGRKS